MRSYAQIVLFTAIGSPMVYLYAMGVGLARLVDGNLGANAVNGVICLAFQAPALLASSAIAVASEEFTNPVILGFKWNPTFFGMNASSTQPGQVINGIVISIAARMLLTCAIFSVFMQVFGAVPGPLGFISVLVALLTGLAFGARVMAYTATLKDDTGQLAMVQRFVILPMTLFAGTFFPLDVLPPYLQWIGWISPLWHGVELLRALTTGQVDPGLLWHVLYYAAMIVVGLTATTRRLRALSLN